MNRRELLRTIAIVALTKRHKLPSQIALGQIWLLPARAPYYEEEQICLIEKVYGEGKWDRVRYLLLRPGWHSQRRVPLYAFDEGMYIGTLAEIVARGKVGDK